ncbi:HAD superfamily hydrolase (TIGR01509 family) [Luteibacter sp. Sphag1AF]|uniref:HAD family hydrolase n=1 Tax=Luteibacter sp. Sphag1AF TaxID=2587031 RepID=UPI00161D1CFD|nr:HAD family phosphatase [Luteibacter sp. Sphag1AF]MBB3228033.1 HAD superfamily hydrolase (TIGR01509 family) [Luteibacter sp. Sphag1AF]
MPPFPFDAVLFDCDGVLVDSEAITCQVLADMLGEMGWHLSLEETMQIFVGKAVRDEAAQILFRTGVAITDRWLGDFRERRNAALERDLVAIPDAPEAVRAIATMVNGRIAVASGADRHKVQLQLRKVGLHDAFANKMFSGHETPRSKPWPDVYLAAAKALGVDPARCAIIEDTATGARAGVAAGATVFGYSPGGPGHSSTQALLDEGVATVFQSMGALPALLSHWPADHRSLIPER